GPVTRCPLRSGDAGMRPGSDCRRGSLDHALRLCIRGGSSMDFYTVLDQVLALLRQRQRETYRALKLQFQLDDEALEALRDELIEAHHLAADEAATVLVWTGDAGSVPAPARGPVHAPHASTPPTLAEQILTPARAV